MGQYRDEFSPHQSIIYNLDTQHIHVLGSNGNKDSHLMFDGKTVKQLAQMPCEKTFFAAVYHEKFIYTFGGYDAYDKCQITNCEYYDCRKDKWFNSDLTSPSGATEFRLAKPRS